MTRTYGHLKKLTHSASLPGQGSISNSHYLYDESPFSNRLMYSASSPQHIRDYSYENYIRQNIRKMLGYHVDMVSTTFCVSCLSHCCYETLDRKKLVV